MSSDNQPIDPTKPDLEESTNVAETHAAVTRNAAAAAREKQLRENGLEPASIWVLIGCAFVALVGGSVLFGSGKFFSYDSFVKSGYVRAEAEGGVSGPPTGTAHDVYMKKGASLYSSCKSCHGADGNGAPGTYPPLAGSEWVIDNAVRPTLVMVNGLKGAVHVKGEQYNGNMPGVAKGMSHFERAALLYYIQNNFGNSVGEVYSLAQMEEIDAISKARTVDGQATQAEMDKYKDTKLTAKPLTKETLLNAKTGEVLDAAE